MTPLVSESETRARRAPSHLVKTHLVFGAFNRRAHSQGLHRGNHTFTLWQRESDTSSVWSHSEVTYS